MHEGQELIYHKCKATRTEDVKCIRARNISITKCRTVSKDAILRSNKS